jgi:N-dimethylarginine dimethylaminohydrolase
MLFDFAAADRQIGDGLINDNDNGRWSVDSEYGRLTDVMLSAPTFLEMVPCNSVSIENRRNGVTCSPDLAAEQHARLVSLLQAEGVRCHLVPPAEPLADLSFTRDATLMTPWGLLGLRPALPHRRPETTHIRRAAASWGVPLVGAISEGTVEGGDVCILRPGTIVIGCSGDRTDLAGARALAGIFEQRGWEAILTKVDPHFLHLDTQFTLLDRTRALACVELLEPAFVARLEALGVELVEASYGEVQALGSNILSLGGGRIVSPAGNERINAELERLGYRVIRAEVDQFTRCGGGIHCLTMPLARLPG